MDFKNKKQELKEQLILALGEWMDNRIDDFLSSNIKIAPFGKYLKRGARNILIMGDKDIDNAISSLLPFIVQDDGDCDISSLFDEIMTKLNSVKIPKRRSHGWLRFWSVLVIVVIGLVAGGVYWFNQQSDADEQIRVRDKAWRELTGLSKTECWFMRWKLAGAQSRVEKGQAEYTSAHQACVKVLTANGFSDADMKLSAAISAFNSDIELLEAANEHFAEYKRAQGELGYLQQRSAADWKDEFSSFRGFVALVVFCFVLGLLALALCFAPDEC